MERESDTGTGRESESHFRQHFAALGMPSDLRAGDWPYEIAAPAYQLGFSASRDPNNAARTYEELDTELERAWEADMKVRLGGSWSTMRRYAREGYDYGARSRGAVEHDPALGGTPEHDRPSFSDPLRGPADRALGNAAPETLRRDAAASEDTGRARDEGEPTH